MTTGCPRKWKELELHLSYKTNSLVEYGKKQSLCTQTNDFKVNDADNQRIA